MSKLVSLALDLPDLSKPHNAGFRIITDYYSSSDATITHLDFKINDNQYRVAISSSLPLSNKVYLGINNMITPTNVSGVINVKINLQQLRDAFAELVADMDKELKEMKGD